MVAGTGFVNGAVGIVSSRFGRVGSDAVHVRVNSTGAEVCFERVMLSVSGGRVRVGYSNGIRGVRGELRRIGRALIFR